MTVTAIVLIKAEPSAISDLGPRLTEIPGVSEAHSVAGSDIDLVAIVRVADHEAIATVVTESISKLAGIEQRLQNLDPRGVLKRGYSITRLKSTRGVVTNESEIKAGDVIVTELDKNRTVESEITKTSEQK